MKANNPLLLVFIPFFIGCGSSDQDAEFNANDAEPYLEQGKAISMAAFSTLSANLKMAMTRGGIEEAVSFCNVAAMLITDSLSRSHGVIIKRTSLKLRNPENKPDPMERGVLEVFAKLDDMGKQIPPKILIDDDNNVRYFAPIMTKNQCLACHGEVKTAISVKNYAFITTQYPADKAIGYNENDLRGMWSITFERETTSK